MLKDKVALVTGAQRGIGKEIALMLGRAGATVIGTGISEKDVEVIDQMLQAEKIQGRGKLVDVTNKPMRESAFEEIRTEFGAPHILINNAGITRDNLMLRMKDEEWDAVINTNLNAVFHMTQLCLRDMLKTHFGRIVNMASVVGITGNAGQVNYSAAKAGVIALTKSLAKEVAARNVTVNAIAPGFIDTDMTRHLSEEHRAAYLKTIPMNRAGQAADIAKAVLFFVSDAADYITGQTLHVNGGMYMA